MRWRGGNQVLISVLGGICYINKEVRRKLWYCLHTPIYKILLLFNSASGKSIP